MSKRKLTGWYPAHIKPVREGVYQTVCLGEMGYSYWTGSQWSNQSEDVKEAGSRPPWIEGAIQKKQWLGLANPSR